LRHGGDSAPQPPITRWYDEHDGGMEDHYEVDSIGRAYASSDVDAPLHDDKWLDPSHADERCGDEHALPSQYDGVHRCCEAPTFHAGIESTKYRVLVGLQTENLEHDMTQVLHEEVLEFPRLVVLK
jgi:hypothetical protein